MSSAWREVHREELVAPRDLAGWDRVAGRLRTKGGTEAPFNPDVAVVLFDGRDENHRRRGAAAGEEEEAAGDAVV